MADWCVRDAVSEDEDCVVPVWLRSLCYSRTAVDLGFGDARRAYSDDQVAWWALNHPIVTALFRHATVRVLCDPDRAHHAPGEPAIIWGWLVTSGDTVYGCGIKNSIMGAGYGRDVARELLGDRLDRTQAQAMELVDLRRLKLVPDAWPIEPEWWRSMRRLVVAELDRDPVTRHVAAYVTDPHRAQWQPRSQRAA